MKTPEYSSSFQTVTEQHCTMTSPTAAIHWVSYSLTKLHCINTNIHPYTFKLLNALSVSKHTYTPTHPCTHYIASYNFNINVCCQTLGLRCIFLIYTLCAYIYAPCHIPTTWQTSSWWVDCGFIRVRWYFMNAPASPPQAGELLHARMLLICWCWEGHYALPTQLPFFIFFISPPSRCGTQ